MKLTPLKFILLNLRGIQIQSNKLVDSLSARQNKVFHSLKKAFFFFTLYIKFSKLKKIFSKIRIEKKTFF